MRKTKEHRYCPKHRFRDPKECKRALQKAGNKRQAAEDLGFETARREIRWYFHPVCGAYHLTSQASVTETHGLAA